MKVKSWIWIAAALISGLLLFWWSNQKSNLGFQDISALDIILETTLPKKEKAFIESKPSSLSQFNGDLSDQKLLSYLNLESQKIAHLDSDPAKIENKLNQLAHAIPIQKFNFLKSLALNDGTQGDLRLLSIELLSRSEKPEALPVLKEIALSQFNDSSSGASANEETAFRASAIEGVSRFKKIPQSGKILEEILLKTDNAFLADRANRTLLYLKNKAPHPEVQDEEALQKILGN